MNHFEDAARKLCRAVAAQSLAIHEMINHPESASKERLAAITAEHERLQGELAEILDGIRKHDQPVNQEVR